MNFSEVQISCFKMTEFKSSTKQVSNVNIFNFQTLKHLLNIQREKLPSSDEHFEKRKNIHEAWCSSNNY